jgi:HSP20 family protein
MINFFKKSKKETKEKERKFEGKLFESEGQLAIDVYQTEKELVIQSAIAGIKLKDLDISIEKDKLTVKGKREKPIENEKINYFYQECYWGPFSREIILPAEIDPSRTEASFKEGILTIRMPKIERERKKKIEVKE